MPPTGPSTHKKSKLALSLTFRSRTNGFAPWSEDQTLNLLDSAEIWSISHGKGPYSHPFWDRGGFFFLKKSIQEHTPAYLGPTFNGGYTNYIGSVVMGNPVGLAETLSPTHPTDFQIWGRGATLISRALPTAPDVSLLTFVGELKKDGIPRIVGSSFHRTRTLELVRARSRRGTTTTNKDRYRRFARDVGGEYLNAEFGWKPLLSDVIKFARLVKRSNEEVKQHVTRGQVNVRRRRALPEISTTEINQLACYPTPGEINQWWSNCQNTITTTEKTWFSGAFKYYVPLSDTMKGRILFYEQQANKLLGTRLTPEVLWNLAPWSWAADWFTNTGDVISNITALGSDRLAMQYGYIMTSSEVKRVSSGDMLGVSGSSTYTNSIKSRHAANPYGFGSDWEGMTPRQIAITTALGLSRVKR